MTLYRDNDGNAWFSDITLDSDGTPIDDAEGDFSIGDWANRVEVTGATNASPIVVTAPGHTFQNGDRVLIIGVRGNKVANGPHTVAGVSGNTFQLSGTTATDDFLANEGTEKPQAVPIMAGGDDITMAYVGRKLLGAFPDSVNIEEGRQYLFFGRITNYGTQIERLETATKRK